METNITSNFHYNFVCEICDFKCCKKGDYNRHLSTLKHKNKHLDTKITSFTSHQLICECGKKYKNRTGLWKHRKKCFYKNEIIDKIQEPKSNKDNKELANELVPLIKELIIDIIPVLHPDTKNINNINHNNTFNINVFLNEQCKDAMNMSDFIESIQFTLEDMKCFGDQGQTIGMANVLVDKLNEMDVLKRPMHCSDIKKEIIYIKDEDKWEVEEKNKPNIRHALDKLTKKGLEAMPCMRDNPDEYVKTITEVLKDPREDKKIISKVAKEIII
jgi:hypothetical protein